jgi:hypothetical protein
MRIGIRRLLSGALVGVAVTACCGAGVAYPAPGGEPVAGHHSASPRYVLDGFEITCLPEGLGSRVSNFEYEFEDVTFRTQVWETGPDAGGAFRTDLNILVLRGEKLRDIQALRDYLTDYQERDPRSWHLERFHHYDQPGYLGDDQAFWLARPGVGVLVKIYDDRFDQRDVIDVAGGVREV